MKTQKWLWIILSLSYLAFPVLANAIAVITLETIQSLIPEGWELNENANQTAQGDLNGDSITDIAITIGSPPSGGADHPDYAETRLQVYFGQANGSYQLAADNAKLIPHTPEIWSGYLVGDSTYLDITPEGYLKVVEAWAGGGESVANHTALFQYRENDWYLVGNGYYYKWLFGSGSEDRDGWSRDRSSSDFLNGTYRAYHFASPSQEEREKGAVLEETCEQGQYADSTLKPMDGLSSLAEASKIKPTNLIPSTEPGCTEEWAAGNAH